jgi:transcriptional regulator with XRE-family HTH domain
MQNFGERLRDARLKKGLKQSDIAVKLDCAPTSLTNWERGKIQPPLDVLSRLCDVLEVSPLDLLSREYSYSDIVKISIKPAYERTYEEQIALNFSRSILEKLMPAELQRQQIQDTEQKAAFLRSTNALERFGGSLDGAHIEALQADYDNFGGADADILFAYHALTTVSKSAFLNMLAGLLGDSGNIQPLVPNMEKAVAFTVDNLARQSRANRHPENVKGGTKE